MKHTLKALAISIALSVAPAAHAGPVASATMVAATIKACTASWVVGPWALFCYASGGVASIGLLVLPSP